MILRLNGHKKHLAMAGAVLLLASMLFGLLTTTATASSVTIKTQQAADSVPNAIRGIDVSEYQGTINWSQVATDNVKFTICRASVGMVADKNFLTNATQAKENGILVGAYHYAKWTDSATMKQEADFFISQLKKVDITYPVFLDLEAHRGLSKNTLTQLAIDFMNEVKAAGYTVMIYSYSNFFRDYLNTSMLSEWDFWVANYVEEPSIRRKVWQHTSYGNIKGINGRALIDIAYEDLALNKSIRVNKTISDTIKRELNDRHDSGLPLDRLDMAEMKNAVVTALQSELNRQLEAGIAVTGVMDASTLNALDQIDFVYEETGGNITYLMQVMLFYSGCYTQELTGLYDAHTYEALERYQRAIDEPVTGTPTRDTLWYLFR